MNSFWERAALEAWMQGREGWAIAQDYPATGWWFPSPMARRDHITTSFIQYRVRGLYEGLGHDGNIHRCRATFATQLRRRGADVKVIQKLLRHRRLSSTAHYLGVDSLELDDAIRLLGTAA